MNRTLLFVSLGAALLACNPPDTELQCPVGGDRVRGTAVASTLSTETGSVLRVQGTAEHQDGLSIQRIVVGDFEASPDEGAYNFSRWTVEIPTFLIGEAGSIVKLEAAAVDACENRSVFDTVEASVTPPRSVTALTVNIDYPGEETYLPATLAVPAAITVSATGDAHGVPVELAAEEASFLGAPGSTLTVKLEDAGGDENAASATAYVTANAPGDLLVTASALGRLAKQTLRVAGPPTIFPGSGTLLAGGEYDLDVLTDGRLDGCEVFAPPSVVVAYDGSAIEGGTTFDLSRGEDIELNVEVDADLAEETELRVTCRDAFGQSRSAVYAITP